MDYLTIKDIARLAHVSHTTVSRVLNNRPGVKKITRERVLKLIKELDYQPSLVARSMVLKKSKVLGLIITTIRNPFYLELSQGIEDTARSFGYSVILCCTNYDLSLEGEHIRELRRKGVDGIILTSAHIKDEYVAALAQEGFPLVLVNRKVLESDLSGKVDYVGVDNIKGGEMALEHLLKMGHRRIGIVRGSLESSVTMERMEGVRRALDKHGLSIDDDLIFGGDYLKGSGYEAAKRFLSLAHPPTAIFSFNDYMALGVYDALLEKGVKVPEDVALLGFNDIEFASLRMVGLSTVSQKKYSLGSMAVRRLMQRIEGDQVGLEQVLEPELIIRSSCGYKGGDI
ncbi:MAG: LacI family DNA-binding transcriptional regulator [Deltaproteobacteria bacterium]|nr:LacI family DNA-binding transcriptional regulator [Deltaproteobacteria bacterium]